MDSNVSYLLLGGEYHGQIVNGYRKDVIQMTPKVPMFRSSDAGPGPYEAMEFIVYKVETYNHSNRLQYMIATCESFESFDIEGEIQKANLPHLPGYYRHLSAEELHQQQRDGVGFFDKSRR
ncbi:hypothetical protein J8631_19885 [Serratia fonticola]|uniref:hypothetical protein n=1 Tax=Serratia fonticola TaxID=47917 RepID=UPI001AEA3944|nr:hypothetical protein [Serratia fonticola]MBP1037833.1 hypothetical protein [Serratia fonticola]